MELLSVSLHSKFYHVLNLQYIHQLPFFIKDETKMLYFVGLLKMQET